MGPHPLGQEPWPTVGAHRVRVPCLHCLSLRQGPQEAVQKPGLGAGGSWGDPGGIWPCPEPLGDPQVSPPTHREPQALPRRGSGDRLGP